MRRTSKPSSPESRTDRFIFGTYEDALKLAGFIQKCGLVAFPKIYQNRGWIVWCTNPPMSVILDNGKGKGADNLKDCPLSPKPRAVRLAGSVAKKGRLAGRKKD